MSSLELPETNVEAAPGLHTPTMPGVLIYEYTRQVTHVVEYGRRVSGCGVFGPGPSTSRGSPVQPSPGGPVKGPKLRGTIRGMDPL